MREKRRFALWKRLMITVSAFILFPSGLAMAGEGGADIEGSWLGTLSVGNVKLRLVFKIAPDPDGALKAVLISVDQGGQEVPADEVSVNAGRVTIKVNRIAGSFEGDLGEDKTSIDGVWKQGGGSFPLLLHRGDETPTAARPQNPKKPFSYLSEEVSYSSGHDGEIRIAGTLTLPKEEGSYPAVILISGSGPQDRDETVFGHRPFLVLADYLTRNGIAVLRVDDRGVGGSTGNFATATTEDFASDVEAGLAFLKTRKEIDAGRMGLVGHSEGGLVAPLVAAHSEDVAFVVLMAAPGLTGEEILYLQGALLARAQGIDDAGVASYRELQRAVFGAVKAGRDETALEDAVRTAFMKWLDTAGDQAKSLVGDPETAIRNQTRMLGSPWFRYFLTHDPTPVLERVHCPVLAINGEKDLQVPAHENLAAIRAALMKGGNTHVRTLALENLNHLFQHARTGSPMEYGTIEETISPEVLSLITGWITDLGRNG